MEGTIRRPQTRFNDRQIPYYEHKQPQYKKEKSNIGRIAFIIYYISIIVALIIVFTTTTSYIPLLAGVVIVSYIAFMFAINFSKYDIKHGNIALLSGLIGIILLLTFNDSNLHIAFLGVSLVIYLYYSLKTLYKAKLKDIITHIK